MVCLFGDFFGVLFLCLFVCFGVSFVVCCFVLFFMSGDDINEKHWGKRFNVLVSFLVFSPGLGRCYLAGFFFSPSQIAVKWSF